MIPKESAPLPGFFPGLTFTTYVTDCLVLNVMDADHINCERCEAE